MTTPPPRRPSSQQVLHHPKITRTPSAHRPSSDSNGPTRSSVTIQLVALSAHNGSALLALASPSEGPRALRRLDAASRCSLPGIASISVTRRKRCEAESLRLRLHGAPSRRLNEYEQLHALALRYACESQAASVFGQALPRRSDPGPASDQPESSNGALARAPTLARQTGTQHAPEGTGRNVGSQQQTERRLPTGRV